MHNLPTILLVACALVVTGLVMRRELAGSRIAVVYQEPVDDWQRLLHGRRIGPRETPAVAIEFSNFKCRYCRDSWQDLNELRKRFPSAFSIFYRHLPRRGDKESVQAALASECAAEQGRFETYHNILFERQEEIGSTSWSEFARLSDVPDMARFEKCLENEWFRESIERDQYVAESLGIRGTPTFIVDGWLLVGTLPMPEWERRIQAMLPKDDSSIEKGNIGE